MKLKAFLVEAWPKGIPSKPKKGRDMEGFKEYDRLAKALATICDQKALLTEAAKHREIANRLRHEADFPKKPNGIAHGDHAPSNYKGYLIDTHNTIAEALENLERAYHEINYAIKS